MARRFLVRALFACACLCAHPLHAQLQLVGKIIGTVRIARGDFPAHPILIELRLRGATVESAYTDGQGRFGFYSLEANAYRIAINDDAYYPVDESVPLSPESPFANLQIVLRPREASVRQDPAGARPAGGNPYLVDPGDFRKKFPKKAVKEYARGIDAEQKGNADEAKQHYQAAILIAPDFYPARNNLGSLYLEQSAFRQAEEQFREAIRLDPNEGQAYFNLANVLMLTSRYAESQTTLFVGLQRRPDSAFGHFLQGSMAGRTGKLSESENELRLALKLDPSMPQARLQLVNLFLLEKRNADAIGELESFLKDFPKAAAATRAREVLNRLRSSANTPE